MDGAEDPLVATAPARGGSAPALVVGRYVIEAELGAGAMGRVYRAIDPELDRKLAIKVLRSGVDDGALDRRLRREAQALARVVHPNVASIYDVGDVDGSVFLAMEYVAGGTLSAWIRTRPGWRDVVRVMAGAGRGLAAVHAAGLVHRDFKPDNVLLDERGAAKVTDFGLVAAGAEVDAPFALGSVEGVDVLGSLTVTGVILGTPAYMAPEQLRGAAADARADQFSFGAALYEALYGARPFGGRTLGELRAALDGPPAAPPAERRVPRWLHEVALRALARDPARRFSSMDALVTALDHGRRRRRWAVALAAVAGAVTLGATVAIAATRGGAPDCGAAAGELAPIWNAARRAEVAAAFARTGRPYAAAAATGAAAAVDGYARQWVASQTEACEATAVRHTQSTAALGVRAACLARRRLELAALVDALAAATPELVEHAFDAVAALPPLVACDDAVALAGVVAAPAAARAAIEAARAELVRADVLIESGMVARAEPIIAAQLAVAERSGYAPLEGEALLRRALLEQARSELPRAAATFQLAAASADRGHDDRTRFEALAHLVSLRASGGQLAEAEAELPLAEAARTRAGEGGAAPELVDLWDAARAQIRYLRGDLAAAREIYEGAIARARARGDRHALGRRLADFASAAMYATDPTAVLAAAEESTAIAADEYGAHHPEYGRREHLVARALQVLGRRDEALARVEHAHAVLVAAYGERHHDVASVALTVGAVLHDLGRDADAGPWVDRAIAALQDTLGPDHYLVADALMERSHILRGAGKLAPALADAEAARDLLVRTLGPRTEGLLAAYHAIGVLDRDLGRPAAAIAAYRAGAELGEQIGPDNPQLGLFYGELGSIELERDHAAAAEVWLTKAVGKLATGSPEHLAYMHLDLAHALAAQGKWQGSLDHALAAKPALTDPPDLAEADAAIAAARRHLPASRAR